jgi:hypothetical protein
MVSANGSGSSASSLKSLAPTIQPIQTGLVPVIAPEREDVDIQETNESAPLIWGEFEAIPESYTATTSGLELAFAQFLGGLIKKVKKAVGALTKLGLSPILHRLKGFVRPLLQRVIKMGIGKQAGRQRLVKYLAPVVAWTEELAQASSWHPYRQLLLHP